MGKGGAGSCLANVVATSADVLPATDAGAASTSATCPPGGGPAPPAPVAGAGARTGSGAGAGSSEDATRRERALVVVTLASRNKSLRFVDNHKLALWGLTLEALGLGDDVAR